MAARSSSALASWRQATSSAWPSRFPPRDHPVLVHAGIPIAAAGALRASVGVRMDASSGRCDTTSSTKSIPAPPCLVLGLRAHAWLHHSIGHRESAKEAQNGKTVRAVCTSGRRKGLTARPRTVKILMRPRARSISGVPQVVHSTQSCLHARLLGWVAEKAGRCPCPDDCVPDDNGPHTREAHA